MSEEEPGSRNEPRRGFITALGAIVVGALAGIPPLLVGLTSILDPLRRKADPAGMVLVTRLAVLPDDGVPRRFTVTSDRVDAWTTELNTPVGAVYLRRTEGEVAALNVVCPHAGCFVGLAPDQSRFACPCHKSSFALDGIIDDPASPSPRDMDALDVEVRRGDEVWVRFQNFRPGTHDKNPVV